MEHKTVRRIKTGSVFKLFAIGLTAGFLPFFLFLGVFAAFGMGGLEFNQQPVTGIKAIFLSPLMAVFMSLIFTALLGTVCAFGLWVFSFFKPLNIDIEFVEE